MADNNIVKIIEAAGKRKQAENTLKSEVLKYRIQSQMRRQEQREARRDNLEAGLIQTGMKDRIQNPQRYTPEQDYLRRRYLEENPLAAMSIPEEQDVQPGQGFGIQMPKDEIVRDDKSGTLSVSPISQDRQAQLLTTKVDQMLAQGKKPHPVIMALADKARETMKQKVAGAISKEERLKKGQELNNLRMYGGEVDDQRLKALGADMESFAKAGGARPVIKDGKRVWQVMPYESFKAKVQQGKWDSGERKDFQAYIAENQQWKNVLKTADELGIGEDDLAYLGEIEFEDLNTPYGVMSLPARFNTYAQFTKDPKYTTMKREIETAFQAFRKRVTGAQAGEKELVYLRQIMPDLKDRPEVFFATIKQLIEDNRAELDAKLRAYQAFGRDTSELEKFLEVEYPDFEDEGSGDEPTATNPQTGEKVVFRGGQWVTATKTA
jgi:hypothetical protein